MKDSLGKIAADRKILYPLVGAVAGVGLLGLIMYLGMPAVFVLLALAAGAAVGHLFRRFRDDDF